MKLYDISGEQFSAMDAPRHLMTESGMGYRLVID